jgi:hypothetical protein
MLICVIYVFMLILSEILKIDQNYVKKVTKLRFLPVQT